MYNRKILKQGRKGTGNDKENIYYHYQFDKNKKILTILKVDLRTILRSYDQGEMTTNIITIKLGNTDNPGPHTLALLACMITLRLGCWARTRHSSSSSSVLSTVVLNFLWTY